MSTNNLQQLYGLLEQVLPIWAAQIQASRGIMDDSITHLSKIFFGLSQRIQTSVELKSQNHNVSTLIETFKENQQQQQKIIDSLLQERKNLVDAINNLQHDEATAAQGKNDTVDESIMYAVELVKSLEQGRIEVLMQYEEGLKQINQKMNGFTKEFNRKTEMLRTESQQISKDISDVLVSLQFQDRVNQMLAHVNNDLNKLDNAIKEAEKDLNADGWIEDFAKAYVMKEQHDIHNQVVDQKYKTSVDTSGDSEEITFF